MQRWHLLVSRVYSSNRLVYDFVFFLHFVANLTLALFASRQVAKIFSGGFDDFTRCFTKPRPSPRLQPVINIDLISCRDFLSEYVFFPFGRLFEHAVPRKKFYHILWNTSVIRVTSRGRDRLAIIMATLTLLARIVTFRSAHAKLLEFSWPRCNTFPYGRTTMACMCCECQDSMISNCKHALILLTLRKIYVFVYRRQPVNRLVRLKIVGPIHIIQ